MRAGGVTGILKTFGLNKHGRETTCSVLNIDC